MKFIINNNIIYHDDSAELYPAEDDRTPLSLTTTQNRLLSVLVRNNGIMLSRTVLLDQVWQAHGQVASGSNLNNAISTLRKLFAMLGAEDIIVTQPRLGFTFNAASLEVPSGTWGEEEKTKEASAAPTSAQPKKRALPRIAGVGLTLLALLSWCWAWFTPGFTQPRYISMGKIGNCDVRFLMTYHKVNSTDIDLTQLKKQLAVNHIQCTDPAVLFYYDNTVVAPGASKIDRISSFYYCPTSETSVRGTQCENVYESWKN
ncbi:helix-turn-helix domain-containing protein [Serratia nevei]|uniref:winged helix-turn-helix domain-containing protein n=1 Tax=Serratia nevei TaxID=2703794 RepID=UPI0020A20C77|nr:helix-turn-helix domain-containing protein [Serratia nevei]MCP1107095.1 helix-turn-helix domain-containing protein [Serratia nevei]